MDMALLKVTIKVQCLETTPFALLQMDMTLIALPIYNYTSGDKFAMLEITNLV